MVFYEELSWKRELDCKTAVSIVSYNNERSWILIFCFESLLFYLSLLERFKSCVIKMYDKMKTRQAPIVIEMFWYFKDLVSGTGNIAKTYNFY